MRLSYTMYLAFLLVASILFIGVYEASAQYQKYGCLPKAGVFPSGTWLNSCASPAIGDYSHDAIWYDLEASVRPAIDRARVLFFGDSVLLYAVSKGGAGAWFQQHDLPFYVLAFEGGEQSGWAEYLLRKFDASGKVLIFNADPYFTGWYGPAAQAIVTDPKGERKVALGVKAFMARAPSVCGAIPVVCGHTFTTLRQSETGEVISPDGEQTVGFPISAPPATNSATRELAISSARRLIAQAGVDPSCVVYTLAPNDEQDETIARDLAKNVGGVFIPARIDAPKTFDGRHLLKESAKRWVAVLLEQLQPVLDRCRPRPKGETG